jgi:hypothetical protein
MPTSCAAGAESARRATAVAHLEQAGILREVTGRARGTTYVYGEYVDILNEGTEV